MAASRTRAPACFPQAFKLPLNSASALRSPAELAADLAGTPGFVWLDSSEAQPGAEAWSFLGFAPSRTISHRQRRTVICEAGQETVLDGPGALTVLARELAEH